MTICARGGSKGIPNKNLVPLGGKPLIAYTVEQARRWGKAARIVCSTDSPLIADAARACGAEVPFLRPAELGGDQVGKVDVIRHAVEACDPEGTRFDGVLDLDVTAPIRTAEDLDGCLAVFNASRPDVVFSVTPARKNPYFNMVEKDAEGRLSLVKALPAAVLRRQDAPRVYDMNASIYLYDRAAFARPEFRSVLGGRFAIYEMAEDAAFDIDGPLDLEIVELIMRRRGWIQG